MSRPVSPDVLHCKKEADGRKQELSGLQEVAAVTHPKSE